MWGVKIVPSEKMQSLKKWKINLTGLFLVDLK